MNTKLIELDGKFEEGDKFFIAKETHCGVYRIGLFDNKYYVLFNCSSQNQSSGVITDDLSTLTNEIFLSIHGISDAIEVKKLVTI